MKNTLKEKYTAMPIKLIIKIINLKRRKEKLKRCMVSIERLDIPPNWEVGVDVVVANEGDGATPYSSWKTNEDYGIRCESITKYWCREMKTGEIGCFYSHLSAIQNSNCDFLLVLEDDADFKSDFLYSMDICLQELQGKKWDSLDFGAISMDGVKDDVSAHLIQYKFTYQAHCILYNRSGIDKIKKLDRTKDAIPFDELIPALRGVHPRKDVQELYTIDSPLLTYHSRSKLSWQRGGEEKDTEIHNAWLVSDIPPAILITIPRANGRIIDEGMKTIKLHNAIDGMELENPKQYLSTRAFYDWDFHKFDHRTLNTAGSIGCYMSHENAWKEVVRMGKPQLILEDDVSIGENLTKLYEEIHGWFYSKHDIPRIKFLYYNRMGNMMYGAAAYLINPLASEILLRYSRPIDSQVDLYMHQIMYRLDIKVELAENILFVHTEKHSGPYKSLTQNYENSSPLNCHQINHDRAKEDDRLRILATVPNLDRFQRKFDLKFEGEIEGHVGESPEMCKLLKELVFAKCIKNVLQIGFNAGHSADLILSSNENINLVSFDLGVHNYVEIGEKIIDEFYQGRHKLIRGDSKKTVPLFWNNNKIKFDLIYIDGGHAYEDVISDLENCHNLAHEETIVILDDTMGRTDWVKNWNIGPSKAWKNKREQGAIKELGSTYIGPGRGCSWGHYNMR